MSNAKIYRRNMVLDCLYYMRYETGNRHGRCGCVRYNAELEFWRLRMKRILVFLVLLATFASAQQVDSTDILITVREDGDTLQTGRWRSGMPVRIRDSWNRWGERERLSNKFVIVRVGVEKSRIDSFLVAHSDSTTGLRRKYQLSRAAIQFVKNNRDENNVVRVTPAQLRNAFKRVNRFRRFDEPQRMGILTPDLFVRWRNMLVAPTLTSVTVNTDGGGDYTALVSAEAGENDNLVTANEQITFNCSGTNADVTPTLFDGWTVDATRFPLIRGNWAGTAEDTTKYRLFISSGSSDLKIIDVKIKNISIENLQIKVTKTGSGVGYCVTSNAAPANSSLTIKNCLLMAGTGTNQRTYGVFYWTPTGGGTHTLNIVNNIISGHNTAPSNTAAGVETWAWYASTGLNSYIYNNIFYNNLFGIRTALLSGSNTSNIKNNIANNNTTDYSSNGGATNTGNNNIDEDGTAPGENSITATVTFTDIANGNFSLAIGSAGINQGADLSSDPNYPFNTDIIGTLRPQGSSWDIGAFEFVPVSEDAQPKKRNGFNGWFRKGFKGRY